jgi:uncharacterized membrane protein (DUF485 family)
LPNPEALAPARRGDPTRFPELTSAVRAERPAAPDYEAIAHSPEFAELRRRRARFVLPAFLAFFAWYFTYVLLAAYAPGFMRTPVVGSVNLGLVLGVLQFVSTVTITTWYTRYARATLDPRVDALRDRVAAQR